jgi:hypothetical protein
MFPLEEPWIIRLGIYWIFGIGALLGLALVICLIFLFGREVSVLTGLGVVLAFGVGGAVLSIAWIVVTTKPSIAERAFPVPVPLGEFLSVSGAVVAPNLHPDSSEKLAEWLRDFSSSHGEDSVWVLPLPDGPFADRLVFAVADLSPSELAALKGFDVDSIESLPAKTAKSVLPQLAEGKRLFEAVWD